VFCTNILELLTSLVAGSFVDDIKAKFTVNIKHIDNNRVIKIDIVF
jgi:hypothetical protein